jgi:hypothetical protein
MLYFPFFCDCGCMPSSICIFLFFFGVAMFACEISCDDVGSVVVIISHIVLKTTWKEVSRILRSLYYLLYVLHC